MKKSTPLIILLTIVLAIAANAGRSKSLVDAAKAQIGITKYYDSSYRTIDYPNGDVPEDRGVCTDVVIRAMRLAYGYDLQKAVHEDMKKHFSKYPRHWGLKRPDRNIDHRRVPNLQTFFERNGWALPLREEWDVFQPGDIVTCLIPPNLPHIMIVSDRKNRRNVPLVIHNIGAGTREEDLLQRFDITGHYRMEFSNSQNNNMRS